MFWQKQKKSAPTTTTTMRCEKALSPGASQLLVLLLQAIDGKKAVLEYLFKW
jgi:hypothetical protein